MNKLKENVMNSVMDVLKGRKMVYSDASSRISTFSSGNYSENQKN